MARSGRKAVEATPASGVAKPAPRGRPTAERAAALDAVIRSAALEVFLASGFAAASMDAIVAAAQVSKGTLYARYENKEALFISVLQGEREKLGERASAYNHLLPDDLEGRLRHHARTLIRTAQSPVYKGVVQLMEANSATFPDLPRLWNEVGTRGYLRLLADNMAAVASPAQRSIDWDFVANLFLHAISGWLRTQAALNAFDEERAITYSDQVIAVVMAWIRDRSRLDPNSPDP
jgi:TetR/AcrR family transcriptional regulator, mexJK operon transcriptional repressor